MPRLCRSVKVMKISVAIVTYKRAWALSHSLTSIAMQTRKPYEVIVVLKPSGDGSESVIKGFEGKLPVKLEIQKEGNVVGAVAMAIRKAEGDLMLFMDDDAIVHEEWISRYEKLFERKDVGGVSGLTYKAIIDNGSIVKTNEIMYGLSYTKPAPHREPLDEYKDYCGWISKSGFIARKQCDSSFVPSALMAGANMGFRRELVNDCPVEALYKKSKKGYWFESLLAYCAKLKGYNTYNVFNSDAAPIAWHIIHSQSLTRASGFWSDFWIHYDRVVMYKRLKKLGASLSAWRYTFALITSFRRNTVPRFMATIYGLVAGY